MIFDSKLIDEITEDEIDALVQKKTGERQHLEFKATIDLKDAEDKLELLHDIASLANGGGGYLIVGIGDDGKGAASGYVPADRLGDPESIKKSIAQLCLDHISERIDGLEVVCRSVKGHPLVIVRVPNSARVPHMVKFERRTDFYSRYHDGKREMTIHEIREAFTHDMIGLRLSAIEAYM